MNALLTAEAGIVAFKALNLSLFFRHGRGKKMLLIERINQPRWSFSPFRFILL